MTSETASPLRLLPSVDAVLHAVKDDAQLNDFGSAQLTTRAREVINSMRDEMRRETGTGHQLAVLHLSLIHI